MTQLMVSKDAKIDKLIHNHEHVLMEKDVKITQMMAQLMVSKDAKIDKLIRNHERVLMKKDVEITQMMASKDAVINKLRQDVLSLKQSLKDQNEDVDCLLFAHWQLHRELRNSMGNIIESKKEIINMLRAKIVLDQGEMCYEMLDEDNEHKRSVQLIKKHADDATKISIAHQQKNVAVTETVQSLQDQLAQMQDIFTRLRNMYDKSKCRIMDLEEETMDLVDTIYNDTPLEIQKYPTGKRGTNAWTQHPMIVMVVVEMLAHRAPPSSIAPIILTVLQICATNWNIVKALPSKNWI